jgi:predicted nucleic acid-binding protein
VILDSSYIFDLIGSTESDEAFQKGSALNERGEVQWLPTPVVAEVYYGVTYTKSEEERRTVENGLMGYPRIDVTEGIARIASRLVAEADIAEGGDNGVEANDAYIGAMAESVDDAVLTNNAEHFEKLGVDVETY